MDRILDIPINRLTGIRIRVKIAGRESLVTLKTVELDVPLPVTSQTGKPQIYIDLFTQAGLIEMGSKDIIQANISLFTPSDWLAEDLLYDSLGRNKPKEVLNPDIVGPVNRKIAKMDDDEDDKVA